MRRPPDQTHTDATSPRPSRRRTSMKPSTRGCGLSMPAPPHWSRQPSRRAEPASWLALNTSPIMIRTHRPSTISRCRTSRDWARIGSYIRPRGRTNAHRQTSSRNNRARIRSGQTRCERSQRRAPAASTSRSFRNRASRPTPPTFGTTPHAATSTGGTIGSNTIAPLPFISPIWRRSPARRR